jgi:hypothetical protein
LADCFKDYLASLRFSDLNAMLLVGGLSRIDITMRWCQFDAADRLLAQWLDAAASVHDPASIMAFADPQVRKGQCRATAKLLERSLKSQDWGEDRLAGQVLRCTALAKLREGFARPEESLKTEQAKTQAGWVATSFGIKNVTKALQEGVSEAQLTFTNLKEPTKQQQALKTQLDTIEKNLVTSDSSGVLRTPG